MSVLDKDGKMLYLDWDSNPIDTMTWAKMSAQDKFKRVAEDTIYIDGKKIWISTVWLGLDHNWGDGPPLIFETMVFREGKGDEMERYTTVEQAREGHQAMVEKIMALGEVTEAPA